MYPVAGKHSRSGYGRRIACNFNGNLDEITGVEGDQKFIGFYPGNSCTETLENILHDLSVFENTQGLVRTKFIGNPERIQAISARRNSEFAVQVVEASPEVKFWFVKREPCRITDIDRSVP